MGSLLGSIQKNVFIHTRHGRIKAIVADTFLTRMRGLLWRQPLMSGEAILITPCRSVHTFGMNYAIDIVFLTQEGYVIKVVAHCPPWRVAVCSGAQHTLEMLAGEASQYHITPGILLNLRRWE